MYWRSRLDNWPIPATLLMLLFATFSMAKDDDDDDVDPWGKKLRENLFTDYLNNQEVAERFLGNQTHVDFFKLLRQDGNSLLIGARNVVFNISLSDLTENTQQRITWDPSENDKALCIIKGKSKDDCQNYIRILARTEDGRLLVCGTNAFNPLCRYYSHNETHTSWSHQFSGRGFCPYDPRHNSTAIYTEGDLYSGTVADFSAADALIIKDSLRTEQYELKHLNAPNFVNSLEDDEHVYFFFRESAVEHINCGKSIFSRVARVCKSDTGGVGSAGRSRWSTFLKARLNCSVPGDIPFQFDEIQATSHIVGRGKNGVVYAVFNTPDNSIGGSAVCSFRMEDVRRSFEEGPFKSQDSLNSNWLPVPRSRVPPGPRPGLCSNNVSAHADSFVRQHPLVDWPVPMAAAAPILVRAFPQDRLTVIAVDDEILHFHILFIGTSGGKVLKVFDESVHEGRGSKKPTPVLIEAVQVFPKDVAVRNLLITRPRPPLLEPKLVVISDHEVSSIPLQRCHLADSCQKCVALRDPYCAWHRDLEACLRKDAYSEQSHHEFLQELDTGKHEKCEGSAVRAKILAAEADNPVSEASEDVTRPTTTEVADEETTASNSCQCQCSATFGESEDEYDFLLAQELPPVTTTRDERTQATEVPFDTFLANKILDDEKVLDEAFLESSPRTRQEKRLELLEEEEQEDQQQQPFFQPIDGASLASVSPSSCATDDSAFSERTLVFSAFLTGLIALSIGFVAGFFFAKNAAKFSPTRSNGKKKKSNNNNNKVLFVSTSDIAGAMDVRKPYAIGHPDSSSGYVTPRLTATPSSGSTASSVLSTNSSKTSDEVTANRSNSSLLQHHATVSRAARHATPHEQLLQEQQQRDPGGALAEEEDPVNFSPHFYTIPRRPLGGLERLSLGAAGGRLGASGNWTLRRDPYSSGGEGPGAFTPHHLVPQGSRLVCSTGEAGSLQTVKKVYI